MLKRLEISNIALIDSLSVDLAPGMNCLTGETGAGKSIIIDSINCILGERTSRDLIRSQSNSASVTGYFTLDDLRSREEIFAILDENDINFEGNDLVLFREFDRSGRNICRICGKSVSLSLLKTIGSYLIDIHGQHDNQSLLRTETHIDLLDLFGGNNIKNILDEYRQLRSEYNSKISMIRKLSGDPAERARRIDLLRYQAKEIADAKLDPKEEETLEETRSILANSEKITEALSGAYMSLSGDDSDMYSRSARDLMGDAASYLKEISSLSSSLEELSSEATDILYNLTDLSDSIRQALSEMSFSPDELERIDDRLDLINNLKRKYGNSVPEIIEFGRRAEEEAASLEGSEELTRELEREAEDLKEEMKNVCFRLHEERELAGEKLGEAVCLELKELEMPGARFLADIVFDGRDDPVFGANGLDSVEFLMSANPGEGLKPLSRVASGGELSRIMLALKSILANVDSIPTMIFDEIDIGISGRTAQSLGEKLRRLSRSHQVICVTHLAIIAAGADRNMIVTKSTENGQTLTKLQVPDRKMLTYEIARLLDGTPSEISLTHAHEMLRKFGR